MIRKSVSVLLTLFLAFNGVSVAFAANAKKTQLELRQIQTRYYDTTDKMLAYRAVFATLQDGGFIVSGFEDQLGCITANRDYKAKHTNRGKVAGYSMLIAYYTACAALTYGAAAGYIIDPSIKLTNELKPKYVRVYSNVLIEPYGKKMRVRISFVKKVYVNADGYSYMKPAISFIQVIDDAAVYQEFFSELDKSLFLETNLNKV